MATRKNKTSKVSRRRKNRTQKGGGFFDTLKNLNPFSYFSKPKVPEGSATPEKTETETPPEKTETATAPAPAPAQPTPGGSKGGKRGRRHK